MLGAVAGTVIAQDKVLLARKAKVGDVTSTQSQSVFAVNVGGQQITLNIKGIEKSTVTEIGEGGRITSRVEGGVEEVLVNGAPMPVPPMGAPATLVTAANRAIITFTPGDAAAGDTSLNLRMHNSSAAIYPDKPVGVGDSWTRDIKADAKTGVRDATAQYKVLAREKVGSIDAFKLSITFAETGEDGMRSSGTIWIDPVTGDELKAELDLRNVPLPGVGLANGTIRQNKVENK
jgi:hypothetical protein